MWWDTDSKRLSCWLINPAVKRTLKWRKRQSEENAKCVWVGAALWVKSLISFCRPSPEPTGQHDHVTHQLMCLYARLCDVNSKHTQTYADLHSLIDREVRVRDKWNIWTEVCDKIKKWWWDLQYLLKDNDHLAKWIKIAHASEGKIHRYAIIKYQNQPWENLSLFKGWNERNNH